MTSPTQRSLARLKAQGWLAQVVERWNQFAKVRQDLFGVIDIVAIGEGSIWGIQACAGSSVAARVKKAFDEPRLLEWLHAGGRFEVWGWRKLKTSRRYEVRRVRIWRQNGATMQEELTP